jgi:hypothetical protein
LPIAVGLFPRALPLVWAHVLLVGQFCISALAGAEGVAWEPVICANAVSHHNCHCSKNNCDKSFSGTLFSAEPFFVVRLIFSKRLSLFWPLCWPFSAFLGPFLGLFRCFLKVFAAVAVFLLGGLLCRENSFPFRNWECYFVTHGAQQALCRQQRFRTVSLP